MSRIKRITLPQNQILDRASNSRVLSCAKLVNSMEVPVLRILLKPSHIRALLKLSQAIDAVSDMSGRLSGWMERLRSLTFFPHLRITA